MVRTEPFFRKCCCCIPLQSCLQIWSCIKVMTDVGVAFFLFILIMLVSNNRFQLNFKSFTLQGAFCLGIIILFIDAVAMVLLSVSLCKKNVHYLNMFFNYSIYMVTAGAVFLLGICIYGAINRYHFDYGDPLTVGLIVCGIFNTCLDVVIILTLKSEIIKLRNKQQFEFVTFKEAGRVDDSQIEEERLHV